MTAITKLDQTQVPQWTCPLRLKSLTDLEYVIWDSDSKFTQEAMTDTM